MKAPKNFYNTVDQRKLGLEDGLLPDVTASDNGKILKVSGGKWVTGDDENTTIIANPEGTASEDLENLQIGDTIYAVNKPTFEVIRGIRLTIADGGEYRTDKPKVEFYDDAGNLMTYPAYTSSCDKSYAGNINLDQVCSVATSDAPGAFTYIFNADVVVSTYHLIKLTNAGSFAGDIAKNIKLELSSDGTNFSEIWSDPAIAWGGVSGASRMIDIKTGDISNTILPIVTSADNGKVLGVVNGVWDKGVKLPVPTSGDNGKSITVDSSGDYTLTNNSVRYIDCTTTQPINYDSDTDYYSCQLVFNINDTSRNYPQNNLTLSQGMTLPVRLIDINYNAFKLYGVVGIDRSGVISKSIVAYLLSTVVYLNMNDNKLYILTDTTFDGNTFKFKISALT